MSLSGFADSDGEHFCHLAEDAHVHQLYFNGSGWADQDLTAAGNGPAASGSSGIAGFADSYGEHVCYVTPDGHIHQLYFNGSSWTDQDLTAAGGGPEAAGPSGLSAFADSYGEHVCYIVAAGQHIHQLYFNGKTWTDQDLTAAGNGPAGGAGAWGIAGFADSHGEHVCYLTLDGHIHQLYFNGRSWTDQDLTAAVHGPAAVGSSEVSGFADSYGETSVTESLTSTFTAVLQWRGLDRPRSDRSAAIPPNPNPNPGPNPNPNPNPNPPITSTWLNFDYSADRMDTCRNSYSYVANAKITHVVNGSTSDVELSIDINGVVIATAVVNAGQSTNAFNGYSPTESWAGTVTGGNNPAAGIGPFVVKLGVKLMGLSAPSPSVGLPHVRPAPSPLVQLLDE